MDDSEKTIRHLEDVIIILLKSVGLPIRYESEVPGTRNAIEFARKLAFKRRGQDPNRQG